ncbi:phosphopantetheine-binding protein [Erwiniaceae bacterium BAC15a-03b]|uniref:Phosphopantetheine-binding protein n=2 Tax=Winslowiella TaxID=2997349 RepID=A0A9J6PWZ6_9GAMM|nr:MULTISPECIES: phosphopantetheine-binding protein [Winslowiella]MCU5775350.1 phosphopantetheine-binding protein [Winslowiella arboricola]MCU5780253.1 phosphopantetheine-binding protein [Winslowiella arboricola]
MTWKERMKQLILEIKQMIIDTLNLEDISSDDIESDAPLFGDGLGLDSIDALELGLAVKNRYGVVLSAESEAMRQHFYSVASLAAFIAAQRTAQSA